MTVSTTSNKISYTGNGVTTVFAFPYPFIAASDLQVSINGVLKTLTTDYTISGTAPYPAGANITFLVAPTNLASVFAARVRPFTQLLDLVQNDPLPADQVEQDFDHVVMLCQQLNEGATRALTIPITDVTGLNQTLPAAATRANQAIVFDAVGNIAVGAIATVAVSPAMQPVVTATTLALARTALGLGTMATQNANAVAVTGGTIDGTAIGATTPSTAKFTTPAVGDNSTNAATTLGVNQAIGNALLPGGRLSLQNNVAVPTTDVTGGSTVYYNPYVHNAVPIYNGTAFIPVAVNLTASVILNATDNVINKNYDIFAYNNAGVVVIGTGPAWTSDVTRGAGAGTTEVTLFKGVWVNNNSIALRGNGGLLATPAVNQATYLGTIRTTAAGQTSLTLNPVRAAGGTNNVIGVWNAYNRVRLEAVCEDSTSSWTYTSSTYRAANNSNSNRISFVDGLQQSHLYSTYETNCAGLTTTAFTEMTPSLDSTSSVNGGTVGGTSQTNNCQQSSRYNSAPQFGFHFIQAVERNTPNTSTATYGNLVGAQSTALRLTMEA